MRVSALALSVAWAVLVFFASTDPAPTEGIGLLSGLGETAKSILSSLTHVAMYAGLASLLYLSLRRGGRPDALTSALPLAIVFTVATAYGGALELYQGTIPVRDSSWADAALNAVGAAAALAAMEGLRKLLLRHGRGLVD